MKGILILSILIALSQSNDDEDSIKAEKQTVDLLQNYINTGKEINKYLGRKSVRDELDVKLAKSKAKVLKQHRKSAEKFIKDDVVSNYFSGGKHQDNKLNGYQMDPILNGVRRSERYSSSDSRSSSRELKDWKTEWKEKWARERIASWNATTPRGDIINMVAARPWGVPCGDPSQHDMPWGTCVLPVECDAEYRVYRGDYFCGRSHFICCSLSFSTYDTYQAFDVSLQDSALLTDSAELLNKKNKASHERKRRNRRAKRRRKQLREDRKRKIRRTIKQIVSEVKRILNRAYRNGTRIRRRKTKTMKKFIKYLKQQYRKDRDSAKDIHEHQMYELDKDLLDRLLQINQVNQEFMHNDTFRNMITNRTMTRDSARMLVDAFPELTAFISGDIIRRANERSVKNSPKLNASAQIRDEIRESVTQSTGHATLPTGPKVRRSWRPISEKRKRKDDKLRVLRKGRQFWLKREAW